ncbi:MAG: single-stranded DNA-binding protein [Desulfobulbaceae bacterium]|nr:MAG: single-stranded DNA-binding protein [Desulfobulbaceae bacterium]
MLMDQFCQGGKAMTRDINEFRFTGSVEQFRRITTRAGSPMISFSARCGKETIRAIAFGRTAGQAELSKGEYIEVTGRVQSNSWTDQDGQQRYGWQVVAETITVIDDDQPQTEAADHSAKLRSQTKQEPQQPDLFPGRRPNASEQFAYQGGPF